MKLNFALAAAALAAAPALAQAEPLAKGDLLVTTRVTQVSSQADDRIFTVGGADSGLRVDVGDDVMPTLGFTYFITDHIAVEGILGATQHQISAKGTGVDVKVHKTWVLPPIVTLQYRPLVGGRFSPYVGAGVNAMVFFSGDDQNGFKVDLDNGIGAAAQAGVDMALTGAYTLNLDVKKVWFKTDANINGGALKSDVRLDPWVVSLGVGRKF